MHICLITHEYPVNNNTYGGIGVFVKTLSEQLINTGHIVTVVGSSQDTRLYFKSTSKNLKILLYPKLRVPLISAIYNSIMTNVMLMIAHNHRKVDIVEGSEMSFFGLIKARNTKHVVRLHGGHHFFAKEQGGQIKLMRGLIEKYSLKNVDAVIGVSQYVLDATLLHVPALKKKPRNVILNPHKGKKLKADRNLERIIFVGTLCHKKGLDILIRAFSMLGDSSVNTQLVIIGRDTFNNGESYLEECLSSVRDDVKKRIIYKGMLSHEEVIYELALSSIAVFPSRVESFGIVAIEAMSQGCITVFTKNGPGPEIIDDGQDGFLVNISILSDLVQLLDYLVLNSQNLDHIREVASQKVRDRFSIENNCNETIKFYASIWESHC